MRQITLSNGQIKVAKNVFLPEEVWQHLQQESNLFSKVFNKKVSRSQIIFLRLYDSEKYVKMRI